MADDLHVPQDVTEAASLATQLHEQLFNTETPEPEPAIDLSPEPAPEEEQSQDDEGTFEKRYKTLQGKYSKEVPTMAAELRSLRQQLDELTKKPTEPPVADTRLEDVLTKLKTEYPDELIENLRLLNRLEAEQITREAIQPIVTSNATAEEIKHQTRVENFVSGITEKAPTWESIWGVVSDLAEGMEPSDPAIAAFLNSPDPSGLYTNLELLNMYNENFDSERFAKVCNLYTKPAAPMSNPAKDALLAPSRSNNQPVPQATDPKLWTMPEIEQFQRDKRADKYSPEQADAIWLDIQKALAENRIR